MLRRLAIAVATIAAFAATAHAGDGRLEINQACVATGCFPGDTAGLPIQTQVAGSYVMTSNLSIGSSGAAVVLEEGATLDMNGFTIQGSVTCTGTPATCPAGSNGGGVITNARSVVRNGTIRGVTSFGVRAAPYVRVENMVIEQNTGAGIGLSSGGCTGCVIQDCQILRNGGQGIALAIGDGALGARVIRNTIHGNASFGVQGAISLLIDNSITSNGGLGAILNYSGSFTGFGNNQFYENNGGNANPQMSGGLSIGTNVCGGDTTCP